jgi:chromosome segregation ATPase
VSDSTAERGQVAGPPAEGQRVEPEPSAPYGAVPTGTSSTEETVEQAIARLEAESRAARDEKEAADSRLADADGRLTALRNLQKDSEKATLAYESVHDQLKIDQQGYLDYYESEEESLEKLLGPEMVAEVKNKSDASRSDYDKAAAAVEAKKADLAAAENRRDESNALRKQRADRVAQYKQLATTIGARHATLKSMRDEVAKARQSGQYALAYWLLEFRDFKSVLDEGSAALIDPGELPADLLAAVNALADAERDHAANESAVGKRRNELAEAERQLADQKAKGETRLRDQLKQLSPASSYP